jgi:hypothetical protein
MSTLVFILAIVPFVLFLLSKIPGLDLLAKPLVDIAFSLIKLVAENLWMWLIWLFKNLWFSHAELLQHLLFSAQSMDPSVKVRDDTGSE